MYERVSLPPSALYLPAPFPKKQPMLQIPVYPSRGVLCLYKQIYIFNPLHYIYCSAPSFFICLYIEDCSILIHKEFLLSFYHCMIFQWMAIHHLLNHFLFDGHVHWFQFLDLHLSSNFVDAILNYIEVLKFHVTEAGHTVSKCFNQNQLWK